MTDDFDDGTTRDVPEADPPMAPPPMRGDEPPPLEPVAVEAGDADIAGDLIRIKTPFGTVTDDDVVDAGKKGYHWLRGDSKKPPEPSGISVDIEDHEETSMHSTWVEHDDPPPPPPKEEPPKQKPAQGSH